MSDQRADMTTKIAGGIAAFAAAYAARMVVTGAPD